MERRKIYLIIIIAILVVLISVAGYFVNQNYRLQQMDKLMLDYDVNLTPKLNEKIDEANNMANLTSPDFYKIGSAVDEAILIQKQMISSVEKAYQYADGEYKELLTLLLVRDRLALDILNTWRSRIDYYKNGNTEQADQLLKKEQDLDTELTKANNEYVNYKSMNPAVKEHTIKFWNSTNV